MHVVPDIAVVLKGQTLEDDLQELRVLPGNTVSSETNSMITELQQRRQGRGKTRSDHKACCGGQAD